MVIYGFVGLKLLEGANCRSTTNDLNLDKTVLLNKVFKISIDFSNHRQAKVEQEVSSRYRFRFLFCRFAQYLALCHRSNVSVRFPNFSCPNIGPKMVFILSHQLRHYSPQSFNYFIIRSLAQWEPPFFLVVRIFTTVICHVCQPQRNIIAFPNNHERSCSLEKRLSRCRRYIKSSNVFYYKAFIFSRNCCREGELFSGTEC